MTKYLKKLILIILMILLSFTMLFADIITITYDNWRIDYNCDMRGYEYFHYVTVPDSGELPRYTPFHKETKLPEHCQQFTSRPYTSPAGMTKFDRGHGVHQNLWDYSKSLMIESNSFANIVPQAKSLNRWGVWRRTEELTECWRDYGTVRVWGGVIWGTDTGNDYFIQSHGVVTPDFLWKVIAYPNGEVNSWLMPNDNTPNKSNMNDYLIAPYMLTIITGYRFDIPKSELMDRDSYSRLKPKGCLLK